jgi:uncharacterized protein YhfF
MTFDPAETDLGSLPKCEMAFPGTLRDQLVAAILDGSKTSTTGVLADFELSGEALPEVGQREVVVDSDDQPVAVIKLTQMRVVPLAQVDLAHAVDEDEGFATVAEWRAGHEEFWHSPEMRQAMNDPAFTVNGETMLVLQRFRLIADLRVAR